MPNRQIRSLRSFPAACVVALLSTAHARAAPVTWTGIGDGVSWTDPLNWSNANFMPPQPVPPGPNDQVIINGPGSVILGPAFAAININSLALSGGRTVRLDAGSLFVTSNITGTTADGVHLRGGMLALAGEFRTARLTLEAGALAGPIVLNAASVTSLAPLEGDLKLLGNTSWFGPIFGGQNLTLEARLNLASTLTFAAATTSTGSITLTSLVPSGSSQITVASGMFINAGTLTFASGGGSRTIAAVDFFQGMMATTLAADELLAETRLPLLPADTRCGFHEVNRRAGDFAIGMSLAAYRIEGGIIVEPRIGVGGVDSGDDINDYVVRGGTNGSSQNEHTAKSSQSASCNMMATRFRTPLRLPKSARASSPPPAATDTPEFCATTALSLPSSRRHSSH